MPKEKISSTTFALLLFALVFTVWGTVMLIRNVQFIGYSEKYGQYSVLGGPTLLLLGLLAWYIAYQNLSPFSGIRQFFEKKKRKK